MPLLLGGLLIVAAVASILLVALVLTVEHRAEVRRITSRKPS